MNSMQIEVMPHEGNRYGNATGAFNRALDREENWRDRGCHLYHS